MLILKASFLVFCNFVQLSLERRLSRNKTMVLEPNKGDTPVRSTQACFPPSHPNTRMSAGRKELMISIHRHIKLEFQEVVVFTGNGRPAVMGSAQYPRMHGEIDMEAQIHLLEQETYSPVLRAFKAQAITWEKECLISELKKELRTQRPFGQSK